MIGHKEKRSARVWPGLPQKGGLLLAAALLLLPGPPAEAARYQILGDSNTFLRLRNTSQDQDAYPLYQYLRLSLVREERDGSALALHTGAWGRLDLGDKWSEERAAGELQHAYLSYRGAENNFLAQAGRQLITEGVALERLDGLYLRGDLAAGFAAALFIGAPVVTEPSFKGSDLSYGGRLSQGRQGYYSVGLSTLKSEGDNARDREEHGVDLWLHPLKQVDITGRSSYNSLSSGWMEHAYTLTLTPLEMLELSGDLQRVNYDDYFFHVTTSALSPGNGVILPGEEMTALGLKAALTPVPKLTLTGDYRNYHYSSAGDAHYGGLAWSYGAPSLSLGLSGHRMYGGSQRLRYYEMRLYTLARMGPFDLAAEFFNVNFDQRVNGVKNSFALTGSAGYRFSDQLRVWGDLAYSQGPDFDDELKGLVKLAYAFDLTPGKGGDSDK